MNGEPIKPVELRTEDRRVSSIDWALRSQCVVIVDRNDGATIILEPEEAEALRQWLAEVL